MFTSKSGARTVFTLLAAGLALFAAACAPTNASKTISRDVIENGGIVPAEELRVAEYLAYYEQKLPEPTNTTLGLDLRLGNPTVPADGGEAWLQIGVQARSTKTEEIAPLNLALVIDHSGSMADSGKMDYVKQSLRVFLESLAPEDIVSIVVYDDTAEVLLPAQRAGDKRWIEQTVSRIEPDGSTNLNAGLMLGFAEVDRNFDIRRNNRVVLLTDGIANVGVTDPAAIAQAAQAYNERGIYLSTIGLGHDINDQLLSILARQGKGGYHFIDSAQEMDKVFRKEVSGLIQKAAEGVSVRLAPGAGVRVTSITGFGGQLPDGAVEINLQDLGTGDNQVVLAHLALSSDRSSQRTLAEVELHYTDLFAQRPASIRLTVLASNGSAGDYDPLQNVEVLRNVTIQRTAEALKEISELYKARRYQEAWEMARHAEQALRAVAALTGDAQMVNDADLMRRYQGTLAQWVERATGRAPADPESGHDLTPAEPERSEPSRLNRSATPTPDAPVIEIQ